MTPPLKTLLDAPRKAFLLARSFLRLAQNRPMLRSNLRHMRNAWREGGLQHFKGALLSIPPKVDADTWRMYQHLLQTHVRPKIEQHLLDHGAPVKISIILPTYNTPAALLKATLKSVKTQLYPNWELCIVDDCSTQPHVHKILQEFAARDPRVKLHLNASNQGVSRTSNQAIAMATGPFVVLLDHDDLLEPQALFRVAQAVLHDDPDLLYSDEIMISEDGKKMLYHAHRPAFSPEYLRGHPYIVHLAGFRTQLLRDLGGFDEKLSISQDYDLILRASEQAQTIVHLPEILYQWRVVESSSGHTKSSEVMDTSVQILQRHLDRTGTRGKVAPGAGFNFFETRYPLQDGLRTAIVIPTKNHGELVRQCIDSIRRTVLEADYEIILVDHASTDPESVAYFESLKNQLHMRVLRYEGPFNFSTINNWAIAQLEPDFSHYLLCNNDIEALEPGWLERMLELAQDPTVGIVGAELLYPDHRSIQHAGVCVGAFGVAEHYGKFLEVDPKQPDIRYLGRLAIPHEISAVTAACMLIRKDAFDAVQGLDPQLAVGFGDVDLCLRVLQKGWRILQCPPAILIHHESFTRGKSVGEDPHPEDSAAFVERWRSFLDQGDPYHNPCLLLTQHSWHIKTPMHCSYESRRRVFRRDGATGRQQLSHQWQA